MLRRSLSPRGMAVTGQSLSEIEADNPRLDQGSECWVFTSRSSERSPLSLETSRIAATETAHRSCIVPLWDKCLTLVFEPAAKSATRPPGSATPRVVAAIRFRSDNEPCWLKIKDVGDRLIVAGCADPALLSWHP
jgi:hypothetical protein